MQLTKTANKRRRPSGRKYSQKKKLLSFYSRRVLQDLADQDWQLIESRTQRTIFDLNDVGTVAPHNQFLHLLDDGGEENLADDETLTTAQTDTFMTALPNAADSNSHEKSEQNAQKVTRELAQRKRTRLPTLGSQIDKDEDKPMDSYVMEVFIYLAFVMIRYHMD